jgi:hypothetical protein
MARIELPINDAGLKGMGLGVQELRHGMRELYLALMNHGTARALTKAEWVAIIVLARATEALESTEVLLGFNRARDAAILLLAIMELEYDVHYIALDHTRAEVWLSHSHKGRKPWRVSDLQVALYPETSECESVKETYRQLSMIKHGNPVSGLSGFPIAFQGRSVVYAFDHEPHAITAFLYIGSSFGLQISQHAVSCFPEVDELASGRLAALQGCSARLLRLFEAQIVRLFGNTGTTEA